MDCEEEMHGIVRPSFGCMGPGSISEQLSQAEWPGQSHGSSWHDELVYWRSDPAKTLESHH
jgi:hypothetical protein